MRSIMAGLLAFGCVVAAHAQQPPVNKSPANKWYVIVPQEGKCMQSTEMARRYHTGDVTSPYAAGDAMRKDGTFKDQDIERDDTGKIKSVGLTNNDDLTIRFYATPEGCAEGLKAAIENGQVANPDELK